MDRLFSASAFANDGRDAVFDVSPDGKRFLMLDVRATDVGSLSVVLLDVNVLATAMREDAPR